MIKNWGLSLCILISFYCISCNNKQHFQEKPIVNWKVEDGYVPDEKSAIKIAEIVWLNIYGTDIDNNKPFTATLTNGNIWVVKGSLNKNTLGGVPYMEIQKSDGRILKVTHGK